MSKSTIRLLAGGMLCACSAASPGPEAPASPPPAAVPAATSDRVQGPAPSADGEPERECHVRRNRMSGEYGCFGCVEEICKHPPSADWERTSQSEARQQGYFCEPTAEGCAMARSG